MTLKRFRKCPYVWTVASAFVLLPALFAFGLIGTAERKTRETNYRSAVGAQEPRKYVSLEADVQSGTIHSNEVGTGLRASHNASR
jgi:hypothetical protein